MYPETLIDNVNAESRLRRKDGTIIDCYLGLSLLDPLDHSKGFITTLMDITDKKKAEEELKIYQARSGGFSRRAYNEAGKSKQRARGFFIFCLS